MIIVYIYIHYSRASAKLQPDKQYLIFGQNTANDQLVRLVVGTTYLRNK